MVAFLQAGLRAKLWSGRLHQPKVQRFISDAECRGGLKDGLRGSFLIALARTELDTLRSGVLRFGEPIALARKPA